MFTSDRISFFFCEPMLLKVTHYTPGNCFNTIVLMVSNVVGNIVVNTQNHCDCNLFFQYESLTSLNDAKNNETTIKITIY